MSVYVIVAAGGQGTRLGGETPKQWLPLGARPMLGHTLSACAAAPDVAGLVVVVPESDIARAEQLCASLDLPCGWRVVAGGARRQDSVANGAAALPPEASVVLVHDAARPFVTVDVIRRVADAARDHGAAIAAVPVHDTVKRVEDAGERRWSLGSVPREELFLAQTPQGFRRDVFDEVVALGHRAEDATDEATLAERAGHRVEVVAGEPGNVKVTTAHDYVEAVRRVHGKSPGPLDATAVARPRLRIGVGYDSHGFDVTRALKLGGITVPDAPGLSGHSDGDAVCHAVTDAVLGAANLGDIGGLFPDTDPAWKDADSLALLREAYARVRAAGYAVENLDVVVVCRRPKIGPIAPSIRERLASALHCAPGAISIKGKTPEATPALADALVVHAVALLTDG